MIEASAGFARRTRSARICRQGNPSIALKIRCDDQDRQGAECTQYPGDHGKVRTQPANVDGRQVSTPTRAAGKVRILTAGDNLRPSLRTAQTATPPYSTSRLAARRWSSSPSMLTPVHDLFGDQLCFVAFTQGQLNPWHMNAFEAASARIWAQMEPRLMKAAGSRP
jgi:hypothetical protein